MQTDQRQNVTVVAWPAAQAHLRLLASRSFRLAAKGTTEFERGRHAGRGEMCEELMNLPEHLAVLAEEDEREQSQQRASGESRTSP